MYPMIQDGVSFGTFQTQDSYETKYYVENCYGQKYVVSYELYRALLRADGTKPWKLEDSGQYSISRLRGKGLIRTSRFVRCSNFFNRFIVFPISRKVNRYRSQCQMINRVLPILSIILFLIGLFCRLMYEGSCGYRFNDILFWLLYIFSLITHEIGHLTAGIAAGYKILDCGILLLRVIPVGLYVACEENDDATNDEKLQFTLSGLEVNLLLAGVFLIFSVAYPTSYWTSISIANINVCFVIVNSFPLRGFDGELALSILLGVDSISESVKQWFLNILS